MDNVKEGDLFCQKDDPDYQIRIKRHRYLQGECRWCYEIEYFNPEIERIVEFLVTDDSLELMYVPVPPEQSKFPEYPTDNRLLKIE